MISHSIPRFGSCIDTQYGPGIVTGLKRVKSGDVLILVVNFAEKTLFSVSSVEWNDFISQMDEGMNDDDENWLSEWIARSGGDCSDPFK